MLEKYVDDVSYGLDTLKIGAPNRRPAARPVLRPMVGNESPDADKTMKMAEQTMNVGAEIEPHGPKKVHLCCTLTPH